MPDHERPDDPTPIHPPPYEPPSIVDLEPCDGPLETSPGVPGSPGGIG